MATHYNPRPGQGGKREVRALNAYITLVRAAESVTAPLARSLTGSGLTLSQFGALEALLHLGPLNPRELGRKLLKTGGNMTMVVDNLEKRGLVERVRDAADRRFLTVHLTAAGRRTIGQLFPEHAREIAARMDALTVAELDTLRTLCRKLGRAQATAETDSPKTKVRNQTPRRERP